MLDASAFEVAALGTVEFLPFILFTLPAGVWVDRLRRRPILIVGDFGRAALLATIPIAYVADALTLGQLYVVGFLVGICTVFFDVAYQSYLPSLVEREQIIEGNSKLEISRSAAQIGGPGLGGRARRGLHRAVRRPRRRGQLPRLRPLPPRGSARHEERPSRRRRSTGEKPSLWTELKEGSASSSATRTCARRPAARRRRTSSRASRSRSSSSSRSASSTSRPASIGLIFSLGSVGSLVAAFTATRISRRFGIGPTTIVVGAALRAGARSSSRSRRPGTRRSRSSSPRSSCFGFTVVVYNIVQVSYRQAICPPRLQGRMNSVMRFIVWGTIPLGTLVGGALATLDRAARDDCRRRDRRRPLRSSGSLFSPQRHLREMPEPIDDDRRPSPQPPNASAPMPELPEVEAWVRELDPLVSRAPIEKAGPAHIATLKTFDPPLSALDGRRLDGRASGAARTSSSRVEDGDLVLRVHLMSAGRLRYLAPGAKGPKTPMFRLRFADGGELVLTEAGKKKRAGVWLVTPEQLDEDLAPPRPGRARARRGGARARSSDASAGSSTRSSATSARSPASGARMRTRSCSARGSRRSRRRPSSRAEEVERLATAIHDDLTRALELREQGKGDTDVYLVHNRLGEPCPQCGTPIARVDFEEHTIYYCPSCQTGGRLLKDRRLSRLLR